MRYVVRSPTQRGVSGTAGSVSGTAAGVRHEGVSGAAEGVRQVSGAAAKKTRPKPG